MRPRVFPWRRGNAFELLIDGMQFFPRMQAALGAAQRRIDFELYLLEAGDCAEAVLSLLEAAVQRGVQVRCLFDEYGSRGLGSERLQALRDTGIELRLYNPMHWRQGLLNLYRDHRKLLLVDGEYGFVGGTGLTDEFWQPGAAASDWHEVMVAMRGPVLADWQQLFERQWHACAQRGPWRAAQQPLPGNLLPPSPCCGDGWGRVAYADADQHRDILHSLARALHGGKRRIWFATPYFLPTWRIRRALRRAAARGVDVRLLTTGRMTDNPPVRLAGQRYYPRLLRAGVRIYEYQPRFLHLKMLLVDDWVSVGSCNFDHWNLRFNLDANLEALDPALARQAEASFLHDFADSREITLAEWKRRPLWLRVQQRLWGWLDRLVINVFNRGR
jgi:phosphatidylserine/phosphatidylglycerophosphate/cardiolipin synthase-like enzyme